MYKQLVETVSCKKAACLCQKPKLMTAHNGHKCKKTGGRVGGVGVGGIGGVLDFYPSTKMSPLLVTVIAHSAGV